MRVFEWSMVRSFADILPNPMSDIITCTAYYRVSVNYLTSAMDHDSWCSWSRSRNFTLPYWVHMRTHIIKTERTCRFEVICSSQPSSSHFLLRWLPFAFVTFVFMETYYSLYLFWSYKKLEKVRFDHGDACTQTICSRSSLATTSFRLCFSDSRRPCRYIMRCLYY